MGETEFPGMHVVMCQNRDSGTLDRSNFRSALRILGGEKPEVVQIIRFGHWACGWLEALVVKAETPEYKKALKIEKDMENYPVVDEEDFFALEYSEAEEYWKGASVRERVELCQRYRVSVFAARRDEMPETSTGELCTWPE